MKINNTLQNLVGRVTDRLSPESFSPESNSRTAKSRKLVIEALEPRILFSGSPAPAEPAPAEAPAVQEAPAPEATPAAEAPAEVAAVAAPPEATVSAPEGAADQGDTAVALTDAELSSLTDAAAGIWASSGTDAAQGDALADATYQIADLSGIGANILGATEGNVITIDDDAAGRGWFVDGTPEDNSEFSLDGSATTSSASGGIDLLSVLLHEQGHVLGLLDVYGSENAGDIMNGVFVEGERRLLTEGQADGAVAGSLEGVHYAITPGGIITGETATARSEFFGSEPWGRPAARAVNDVGMTGEGATGVHQTSDFSTGWGVNQPGNIAHWFKVDLGEIYDVENMYVWNGLPGIPSWGAKTVDIYYATTDSGNNTHEDLTDFDTTGWNTWGTVDDLAQYVSGSYTPTDTIALNVNARYIVLNVTAAHGGINNTSIAELQFSGTLPATGPAQWDVTVGSGDWDDGSSWQGGAVPTFAAGDTALIWYDNHLASEGVFGGQDQPWQLNPDQHTFGVELNSTVTLGTIVAGHDNPGSPISESGETNHWDQENFLSHFYGTGKVIWDNLGAGALFDQSEMNFRDPNRAEWSIDMELADDLKMDIHTERDRRLSSTITESGGPHELEIRHNPPAHVTDKRLYISGTNANTYSGGTKISGNAYVELQKDGALGTGDVTIVDAAAQLRIQNTGGTEDRIDDSAGVYLVTGSTLILDSGVDETVGALYFDGVKQVGGTWGRIGLAGVDNNSAFITGDGVLTAPPAPTLPFEDTFSDGNTRDGWVQLIDGATTYGYDGTATMVDGGNGQPSSLWHNFADTVLEQGETLSLSFDVMMSRTTAQGSPIRFGLGFSSSPLVDGPNANTPVDGYMSSAPFLGSDADVLNYWMDGDPGGINWGNAATVTYAQGALDNDDAYTVTNTELRTVTYEISRSASDVLSAVTSVNGEYSASTVLADQIADFKFNALGFMAPYNSGQTFTYDNVKVEVVAAPNTAPVIATDTTISVANSDSKIVTFPASKTSTLSFDAGATSDKLVVQVSGEVSGGATVVTYNGEALTLAPGTASGRSQGIYYLDNPYTGGAADLTVDMTAKGTVNGIAFGVVSLSGTAPGVAATAASSTDDVTINTAGDDFVVVAGFGAQGGGGSGSADAPLNQLYGGQTIGSAEGSAGYENGVDAGSHTYSFSGGNTPEGTSAAAFTPASNFEGAVTEDDSTPDLTDTGTLTFTDVDLTDAHTVAPAHVSTTGSAGVTIPTATSDALETALATVIDDVSTGDGAGTIDWTFTLDNSLTQFLGAGESITAVYDVTVIDDSGVTAPTADVVYNLTVDGGGLAGTLTFDSSVAPTSVDGGTGNKTFTNPTAALPAFSFTRDGSTAVFDQTDNVFELFLVTDASNTPLFLKIDIDDTGGDFLFVEGAGLDFTTGTGQYQPGAVNVTGAALTPAAAPTATGDNSDTEQVTITITGVNDAPTLGSSTLNFNDVGVSQLDNDGDSVADLLNGQAADVDNNTDDADVGIAVTSTMINGTGTGVFQYQLADGGSTAPTGSAVSVAFNAAFNDVNNRFFMPTDTAGVVPLANWNNADASSGGTYGSFVDESGNASALTISSTTGGNGDSWNTWGGTPDWNINSDWANGLTQMVLSDIPYSNYDLIVYAGANFGNDNTDITVGGTTINLNDTTGGNPNRNLVSGRDYVTFSGLSGSSQTVDFANIANGIGVGGFQVVEVDVVPPAWTTFSASEASSLLLRPDDRIRFLPDGTDFAGGSIDFRAWDRTTGNAGDTVSTAVNGGTSAFSGGTASNATVTIAELIKDGTEIFYTPTDGEVNTLTVTHDATTGELVFVDTTGDIGGTREARMVLNPDDDLTIETGDANDTITIGDLGIFNGSLTVDGEDGFDTIQTNGTDITLGTDDNVDFDAEKVLFNLGTSITVTGDGTIDVDATGGGAEDFIGIQLKRATLTSADGDITLDGEGGSVGKNNDGVLLSNGGSITTTGGGSVNITGTATSAAGANDGVSIQGGADITVSGDGTIGITGAAAGSTDSYGVQLFSGTEVTSADGDITLTGTNAGTGARNSGIYTNSATVTTTGAGSIILDGEGSGSGSSSMGLRLTKTTFDASGAGGITLAGTGGGGTSSNIGVQVGVRTTLTTASGDVTIDGTGDGTGSKNRGVSFGSKSSVTGGGAVTITGTGGSGTSHNDGVGLTSADITAAGDLSITGTANGSASYNRGIDSSGSSVTGANVSLTGSGSTDASGRFNDGVYLNRSTADAGAGTLLVDASGGTGSRDNRGLYATGSELLGTLEISGVADATSGAKSTGVHIQNSELGTAGTIFGQGSDASPFGVFLQRVTGGPAVGDISSGPADDDDEKGGNYFPAILPLLMAEADRRSSRKRNGGGGVVLEDEIQAMAGATWARREPETVQGVDLLGSQSRWGALLLG